MKLIGYFAGLIGAVIIFVARLHHFFANSHLTEVQALLFYWQSYLIALLLCAISIWIIKNER
jgi:hypothetical protein